MRGLFGNRDACFFFFPLVSLSTLCQHYDMARMSVHMDSHLLISRTDGNNYKRKIRKEILSAWVYHIQ